MALTSGLPATREATFSRRKIRSRRRRRRTAAFRAGGRLCGGRGAGAGGGDGGSGGGCWWLNGDDWRQLAVDRLQFGGGAYQTSTASQTPVPRGPSGVEADAEARGRCQLEKVEQDQHVGSVVRKQALQVAPAGPVKPRGGRTKTGMRRSVEPWTKRPNSERTNEKRVRPQAPRLQVDKDCWMGGAWGRWALGPYTGCRHRSLRHGHRDTFWWALIPGARSDPSSRHPGTYLSSRALGLSLVVTGPLRGPPSKCLMHDRRCPQAGAAVSASCEGQQLAASGG